MGKKYGNYHLQYLFDDLHVIYMFFTYYVNFQLFQCNARYITCSRTWRRWLRTEMYLCGQVEFRVLLQSFCILVSAWRNCFVVNLFFFSTFQFSKRNYFCTLAHIPFTITPYLHFTISLFRHFARHFVISPFRVLDTPKSRKLKFTR